MWPLALPGAYTPRRSEVTNEGFISIEDELWYVPCPPGFKIGPWREACEEVGRACGDEHLAFHHEDLKRLLDEILRVAKPSAARPSED